jgi:hypothetical protein
MSGYYFAATQLTRSKGTTGIWNVEHLFGFLPRLSGSVRRAPL